MKIDSTNTRIVLAVIALAILAGLAGCVGSEDPETNDRIHSAETGNVVEHYEVLTIDGERFVCFQDEYEESLWCGPLEES